MNKRKFGRTGLLISEIGLDAARLAEGGDDFTSFALLDTYLAGGGRFIQSAGVSATAFNPSAPAHGSEDLVGRWHTASGIDRDQLVLAARFKFHRPAHGGTVAFEQRIRESLEASLRRLRTSHLDLLVCDWDDHLASAADLSEAADRLVRAGLVRHVVAGGFPPWRVADWNHRARARGQAGFAAIQADYSLVTRADPGAELLDLSREHRLGFIATSPLAGGRLARRPVSLRELINVDRNWQAGRSAGEPADALLRALAEIADRRLAAPGQIALAWVLRHPQVASALIAASTADELRQLMRAANLILTNEDTFALAKAMAVRPLHPSLSPAGNR